MSLSTNAYIGIACLVLIACAAVRIFRDNQTPTGELVIIAFAMGVLGERERAARARDDESSAS